MNIGCFIFAFLITGVVILQCMAVGFAEMPEKGDLINMEYAVEFLRLNGRTLQRKHP